MRIAGVEARTHRGLARSRRFEQMATRFLDLRRLYTDFAMMIWTRVSLQDYDTQEHARMDDSDERMSLRAEAVMINFLGRRHCFVRTCTQTFLR